MRRGLLIAAAVLAAGAAFAQGTYRWVDADGRVHYSDQAPPPNAREVEEKRYRNSRAEPPPSYAMRKRAADFPVVLYTAENCEAPCATARQMLAGRGVPFTEKPVKTEADLAAYRELFGAPDEVPALTVGRHTSKGFAEGRWNQLLDSAGYPKATVPPR